MTYVPPTTSEFKTRFPTFADVDDAIVQAALDEGAFYVDDSWISEEHFKNGRMLYAAHILTLDGLGTGPEAVAAANGLAGVRSYRSGNFSVDRSGAPDASSGAIGTLASTSYGIRFKRIQRINAPPVTVV